MNRQLNHQTSTSEIFPLPVNEQEWAKLNRQLASKIIAECAYEECIEVTFVSKESGKSNYRVALTSGVEYQFSGYSTIWGFLDIDAESLTRLSKETATSAPQALSATQLLLDAQVELKLNDIVLGNLIEELQNTLYSDAQQYLRVREYDAETLIRLPAIELQSLLSGHPKAIANKGRMGWGQDALSQYSPESMNAFSLRFIAVLQSRVTLGVSSELTNQDLIKQSLTNEEFESLNHRMVERQIDWDNYWVMPVHPWQWQQFIALQYMDDIAHHRMVDLGVFGDEYRAQQSIRTLSNIQREQAFDIKLPLTILNTSCHRGIPGKHIASGADLSQWIEQVVSQDTLLNESGLIVQQERAGAHVPHPMQQQIENTPYRYNEMLGVVWRDSLTQHLKADESGVLMAVLMEKDIHGNGLITEYVKQSGLSTEAWLRALFQSVVIPLYHLLTKYGIGLVAHGQNISLILNNGVPVRAGIKDFHGDLRIVDQAFPELDSLPNHVREELTTLPPHYLIHDLITGHFVTTLRFISPIVASQLDCCEERFYEILSETLQQHMNKHSELNERFSLFPVLDSSILKVCINRVRFRIGYGDLSERPIPELGTPLQNPLAFNKK